MDLTLEFGEVKQSGRCACCGGAIDSAYGFVYADGDAFAIYHAAWAQPHLEEGAELAVDLGDWGEEAELSSRCRFTMRVKPSSDELLLSLVDTEGSSWSTSAVVGNLLSAAEARAQSDRATCFRVAEFVLREDPRLAWLGA